MDIIVRDHFQSLPLVELCLGKLFTTLKYTPIGNGSWSNLGIFEFFHFSPNVPLWPLITFEPLHGFDPFCLQSLPLTFFSLVTCIWTFPKSPQTNPKRSFTKVPKFYFCTFCARSLIVTKRYEIHRILFHQSLPLMFLRLEKLFSTFK